MKACLNCAILRSLAALLLALAAGCSEGNRAGPDHSPAAAHEHGHGHSHVAPHGGTVVVLGNEAYHVELVHDREAGRLALYVLDGHMESFIRLPAPSLQMTGTINGNEHPLTLAAVAQAATGETVGNTSQFAGEAEWLKTADRFTGILDAIEIRGTVFADQAFAIPGAAAPR